MISRFGRPVPELCMITSEVMDNIFNNHGHRISQWNDVVLSPHLLQEYGDVMSLENCCGFIDRTVRPIARPDQQQRIVYNGHKRVHSLKFQSVILSNWLIVIVFGPVGTLVTYDIYSYIYYKDLIPDFHDRAGCFLVEIGFALPCFLFFLFVCSF